MIITEQFKAQIEKRIPRTMPIEQLRQWVINRIQVIDENRRGISERIKSAEKDKYGRLINDGDVRAKTKSQYLLKERVYLREVLGQVNRKIKERNVAMHSLSKNDVQIFIEMARLIEEQYPDIYDEIRDRAEANLNIRQKRTHSGYVKIFKERNHVRSINDNFGNDQIE